MFAVGKMRSGGSQESGSQQSGPKQSAIVESKHSGKESVSVLRSSLMAFCFVGLFSIVVNLLFLTVPIYMLQLSDRVLVSQSQDTLVMLSVVAVGALLILSALDFVRRMILSKIGVRVETKLGGPVLAASVEAKLSGHSSGNDTQALRDVSAMRSFLSSPVLPLMIDLPIAPLYVVVVFLIHPVLGFLCAGGAIILFVLAIVNQRATNDIFGKAGTYHRGAIARAEAQLRNAEAVKSMGMVHDCVNVWGEANAAALVAQSRAGRRNTVISGMSKFLRLLLQLSLLGFGCYLALYGHITAGMMIAASIVGGRALQPIEGAIEGWRSFVQAREAYGRVRGLLTKFSVQRDKTLLPEPQGHVQVDNAWFVAPESNDKILQGISFDVDPGSIIGVVGPTGAGKSSLLRLLVGAHYPSMGHVRLDGADLRLWDSLQLGAHVGYLPQDVELFPGTVAGNIARLKSNATSEEIVEAAQFAGAHNLIVGLKGGYETRIHLDGAPLSGGQRQRVALARAFFRKPKLVVLDEPDASLDGHGQKALADALARAKNAGITVIMSTQRTGLLSHVDKVLILREGRILDYAPMDQLKVSLAGSKVGASGTQPFNMVMKGGGKG